MIFKSPDGKIVLHITIVGFFDDTTVITGGTQQRPIKQLLKWMQHNVDLWNQLLWASGGKLELLKCGYHIVHYDFIPEGDPKMWVLTSKEIFLPDSQDESIPIQANNVFQPRKDLGHYKSPGGTSKTQIVVITKKALNISKANFKTKALEMPPWASRQIDRNHTVVVSVRGRGCHMQCFQIQSRS